MMKIMHQVMSTANGTHEHFNFLFTYVTVPQKTLPGECVPVRMERYVWCNGCGDDTTEEKLLFMFVNENSNKRTTNTQGQTL